MAQVYPKNVLYYGDNLYVLRDKVRDESVDLCYIDPPFNSKRNYNQIYNNIGQEDRAQARAFVDTWVWDDHAAQAYHDILSNVGSHFTEQTIELTKGLRNVLREGSLFAYVVTMTVRMAEIWRVLKPTGSLYVHCDPTASHYLKIVLDGLFCSRGGDFKNEIIWRRTGSHNSSKRFGPIHDVLLFFTKSASADSYLFRRVYRPYLKGHVHEYFKQTDKRGPYWTNALTGSGTRTGQSGRPWRGYDPTAAGRHWAIPGRIAEELQLDEDLSTQEKLEVLSDFGYVDFPAKTSEAMPTYRQYLKDSPGLPLQDIWSYQPHTKGVLYESDDGIDEDVRWLVAHGDPQRIGFPTQKPEGLLERIIKSSSEEGSVVLDAYCGCGTTIAVAQKLNRRWIGIDITYQSISTILNRLHDQFPEFDERAITLTGMPADMKSAIALAHKRDDRVRKEFEKWAVLTYCRNRAVIHEKKGADKGIDGVTYILTSDNSSVKMILQVKSGGVNRKDISALIGDMGEARLATLITLEEPTREMLSTAKAAGIYDDETNGIKCDKVTIVTVREIIEGQRRIELPLNLEMLRSVQQQGEGPQLRLKFTPIKALGMSETKDKQKRGSGPS